MRRYRTTQPNRSGGRARKDARNQSAVLMAAAGALGGVLDHEFPCLGEQSLLRAGWTRWPVPGQDLGAWLTGSRAIRRVSSAD